MADTRNRSLRLTVLVDDPESWIIPWAKKMLVHLSGMHRIVLVHDAEAITQGDVCFLLGCVNVLPPAVLAKNKNNIVVHESDLPKGRGFSPVAWQVLAGAESIPVTLFEATADMDAGPVWLRSMIMLDGTELMPELRRKQGEKTVEMCLEYLKLRDTLTPVPQRGAGNEFRHRNQEDDRLDPEKTIAEQFNHLRVVDNERYPAWFKLRGRRYRLFIAPMDEEDDHA